jgi:hypothetical protein
MFSGCKCMLVHCQTPFELESKDKSPLTIVARYMHWLDCYCWQIYALVRLLLLANICIGQIDTIARHLHWHARICLLVV